MVHLYITVQLVQLLRQQVVVVVYRRAWKQLSQSAKAVSSQLGGPAHLPISYLDMLLYVMLTSLTADDCLCCLYLGRRCVSRLRVSPASSEHISPRRGAHGALGMKLLLYDADRYRTAGESVSESSSIINRRPACVVCPYVSMCVCVCVCVWSDMYYSAVSRFSFSSFFVSFSPFFSFLKYSVFFPSCLPVLSMSILYRALSLADRSSRFSLLHGAVTTALTKLAWTALSFADNHHTYG